MKNNWLGILLLLASSSLLAMEMPYYASLKEEDGEEEKRQEEKGKGRLPSDVDEVFDILVKNKSRLETVTRTMQEASAKLDDAKKAADQLNTFETVMLQQLERGQSPERLQMMLDSVAKRGDKNQVNRWLTAAKKGCPRAYNYTEKALRRSMWGAFASMIALPIAGCYTGATYEAKLFKECSIGAAVTALLYAKIAQRNYNSHAEDALMVPVIGSAILLGGFSLQNGLEALNKKAAAKKIGNLLTGSNLQSIITTVTLAAGSFLALMKAGAVAVDSDEALGIKRSIIAPLQAMQNALQSGNQPAAVVVHDDTKAQSSWCTII
jgi:hypothetical protein